MSSIFIIKKYSNNLKKSTYILQQPNVKKAPTILKNRYKK